MENVGDEQLEAVSGGVGCIGGTMKCPECGSKDIKATEYKLTEGRVPSVSFFCTVLCDFWGMHTIVCIV